MRIIIVSNNISAFFKPKKTKDEESPPQSTAAAAQKPSQIFYSNLGQNLFLSVANTPAEGMALRRIFFNLQHPQTLPPTYLETAQKLGYKGVFAGVATRTSYCLSANLVALEGINYFGSDYQGMIKTSLAQNVILPLFLASNARQTGLNFQQTIQLVAKGFADPVVHGSFFLRSSIVNSCVFLGFSARNYIHQATNGQSPTLSNSVGIGTAAGSSALLTAFLKPFYTGTFPLPARVRVATSLPAKLPLLVRELTTMGLIFGNTRPKEHIKQNPPPKPSTTDYSADMMEP
jgi:hypothetical protein